MKKFFILAGEPSGDLHGAKLMEELHKIDNSIVFEGIGGEKMQNEGLNSLIPISQMSVVGMLEVLKKIAFFKNVMNKCKLKLSTGNYDAFIPIDYPGFNLRLASYSKSINIPVLYYIAPQLWAWGKNRAAKLKDNVDLLLTVLPFEKDFFNSFGIKSEFVGHPLLDQEQFDGNFQTFNERERIISIFPGSRKQEIQKHSNLVIEIISFLLKKLPKYEIHIAKSNSVDIHFYKLIQHHFPDIILNNNSSELMKKSTAGIIKTGTTNLEAALCGLPINMFYKTSFVSYQIGKQLVNLEHISLINILLNKTIIKEFIQQEAKAELISNDIIDIINNKKRYSLIQQNYFEIKKMLGNSGASKRAANLIMNYLQ